LAGGGADHDLAASTQLKRIASGRRSQGGRIVGIGLTLPEIDYRPSFPQGYSPGVGIIGCGAIVKSAHLKAYAKFGVNVIGVYDISPEATRGIQEEFGVPLVFETLDALLAHPQIEIVDIATRPEHRVPLMRHALAAGKHILAQKPLAPTMAEAREIVEEADRLRLKLAVNQNGRWLPPWRIASLLIHEGVVGEVLAITHLYDMKHGWTVGTHFDDMPHFAIYDFSIHRLDIIRCWMGNHVPVSVRARDYRTPNQPPEGKTPWGAWIEVQYEGGANAMVRGIGCSETVHPSQPFWVHGAEGTIRGSVLGGDFVEAEKGGVFARYNLEGDLHLDRFAATMGELCQAIADDREPFNSGRHNLLSLQMTLAAVKSAEEDGRPVSLDEVG
jgi:predicted dehydrogenase